MKRINCNKILRNWILLLFCCTLTGIFLDILFSVPVNRQKISLGIDSNTPEEKYLPEENPSKSAFDSIRNEYLLSCGLDPDSIINL